MVWRAKRAPEEISLSEAWDQWLTGKRPTWPFARDWCWASLKAEIFPLNLTWIFTFGLTVFAYYAWQDAKDTSNKLQDQLDTLKSDQRPWLYVTDVSFSEPIFSMSAESPQHKMRASEVIFNLNNTGKSPAQAVIIVARIIYRAMTSPHTAIFDENGKISTIDYRKNYVLDECTPRPETNVAQTDRAAKAEQRSQAERNVLHGEIAFPSQPLTVRQTVGIYDADLKLWNDYVAERRKDIPRQKLVVPFYAFFIAGCVEYRTSVKDRDVHITPFLFQVERKDGFAILPDELTEPSGLKVDARGSGANAT